MADTDESQLFTGYQRALDYGLRGVSASRNPRLSAAVLPQNENHAILNDSFRTAAPAHGAMPASTWTWNPGTIRKNHCLTGSRTGPSSGKRPEVQFKILNCRMLLSATKRITRD